MAPRHVFEQFRTIVRMCNFFLVPIVKYEDRKNAIELTDNRMYDIIVTIIMFVVRPLIIADVGRSLMQQSAFTKSELIYLAELPIGFIFSYYFGVVYMWNRKKIPMLIESLQMLDTKVIGNFLNVNNGCRTLDIKLHLVRVLYACQSVCTAGLFLAHVMRPDLKIYTAQALTGHGIALILCVLFIGSMILTDRVTIFARIIDQFAQEDQPSWRCAKCMQNVWNRTLCKGHQIEFVACSHAAFLTVANILVNLYDLIASPLTLIILMQAPGCLINFITLIFGQNKEVDMVEIIVINALILFVVLNTFLGALIIEQISVAFQSFSRHMHKLVRRQSMIDQKQLAIINSKIIGISTYMLQDIPRFTIYGFFPIGVDSFITVFSSLLLLAVLLMQSDL